MAKKRDDNEHIEFRFDPKAGGSVPEDEPAIDLFEGESDDEKARKPVEVDSFSDKSDDPAEEMARMFDRYGRNISKKRKKKNRYGKRKNISPVAPRSVMNETIAFREYEAAKERSRQRAARREAKEQRERERRAKERRAQRIRLLKTLGFGAAALAILLFAAWFTTRISDIQVNAVEGYTAAELITKSGLKTDRSIVFSNLAEAKENIEQDAYLQANVKYSFPSTVTISVVRRVAAACVRWGPQSEYLAIIDPTGVVLESDAESTQGLIVAEGLSITTAQEGRMLGESTDLQVNGLIRILSKLVELDLMNRSPRLSRIDMNELMSISISTEGANYSIEVGDTSNLDTKLMLLQRHWNEIMDSAAQYIANGYSTATIYLYSKGGISISPYAPGYNSAMQVIPDYTLPSDDPNTTPQPVTTPDPNATAPATSTPEPTVMPHQNGEFTG